MASYTNSLPRQSKQQQQLREFQYRSKMLLNEDDREYLYGVMKEYQRRRHLDKFMLCVRSTLDTPAKMDLLKDIRNFVALEDLAVYDRLAPYRKMAHPWPQHHSLPATPLSVRAGTHRATRHTPQHTPASRHRGLGGGGGGGESVFKPHSNGELSRVFSPQFTNSGVPVPVFATFRVRYSFLCTKKGCSVTDVTDVTNSNFALIDHRTSCFGADKLQ